MNQQSSTESARHWAATRLAIVAEQLPDVLPPDTDTAGLSPADAALALAIYRTTVQRWFTLQQVTEKYLSKQLRRLEPGMQAVLLSGAAQLVFFDRLPSYAVVDESVELARNLVRPNAAGMVNAVLRQVDRLTKDARRVGEWSPDPSLVPLPGGKALRLGQPVMPEAKPIDKHLVAATSVPLRLVREWVQRWGDDRAARLCLHTIENPPTTIAVEPGFAIDEHRERCRAHEREGFVTWHGPSVALSGFLQANAHRRVQDVASSLAITSLVDAVEGGVPAPAKVLDYCAGKGTKTRQIALAFPDAQVTATDTHPGRREELRTATAGLPNVTVVEPDRAGDQQYDLVLLDVPCSNTGVLARRPEARYRYTQQALGELVTLQRQIIDQATAWLTPGGLLLYSTCSVEPPENHKQAKRLVRQGAALLHEHQQLPVGSGDTYTDGSYHALLKV